MTTPLSVPTITVPDPATATLAGQQATEASDATRKSDFSSVLNESAAKPPSTKEKPATAEDPSQRQDKMAAKQVDTAEKVQDAETEQCACPEQGPVPAVQAATVRLESGNALPPWLHALLQPAPAERSIEAIAGKFASTSGEGTDGRTLPANPIGPATVEKLSATHSGVGESGKSPAITVAPDARLPAAGSPLALAVDTTKGLRTDGVKTEIADISAELVSAPSTSSQSGDRATLLLNRLEPSVVLAQPTSATQVSATTATNPAPVTVPVQLPLSHPQWQDAFAARVVWQATDGLQRVNLAINPPDLGPVEVRMSVTDDKVSAQFFTHHHSVRQVIEDAMPRLRDLLSQSGLNLADASVFQQASHQDRSADRMPGTGLGAANSLMEESGEGADVRSAIVRVGLIDLYA